MYLKMKMLLKLNGADTPTTQLSAGAFAGSVVAVVALLVLIGITLFFVVRKTKDKVPRSENRPNAGRPQEDCSLYSNGFEKVGEKVEPYYINMETRPAVPRYETLFPETDEPNYEAIFPYPAPSVPSNIYVKKTPRV